MENIDFQGVDEVFNKKESLKSTLNIDNEYEFDKLYEGWIKMAKSLIS